MWEIGTVRNPIFSIYRVAANAYRRRALKFARGGRGAFERKGGGQLCRCWPYGRVDRRRKYSVLPVSFRRAGLSVRRCSFLIPLACGSQSASRGATSQGSGPAIGGSSEISSRRRRRRFTKARRFLSKTFVRDRNLTPRNHGCLRVRLWFILVVGWWLPSKTLLVRFCINSTATRRSRSQAVGHILASLAGPSPARYWQGAPREGVCPRSPNNTYILIYRNSTEYNYKILKRIYREYKK